MSESIPILDQGLISFLTKDVIANLRRIDHQISEFLVTNGLPLEKIGFDINEDEAKVVLHPRKGKTFAPGEKVQHSKRSISLPLNEELFVRLETLVKSYRAIKEMRALGRRHRLIVKRSLREKKLYNNHRYSPDTPRKSRDVVPLPVYVCHFSDFSTKEKPISAQPDKKGAAKAMREWFLKNHGDDYALVGADVFYHNRHRAYFLRDIEKKT